MNVHFIFDESLQSGLNPAIANVFCYARHSPIISHLITNTRYWAVEYNSRYGGTSRFGKRAPYYSVERKPGTVIIYTPETAWRENRLKADMPIQETYASFRWDSPCPLEPLLHTRLRFAEIHEPSGRVGALIREAALLCKHDGNEAFFPVQIILFKITHLLIQSRRVSDGVWELIEEHEPIPPSFSAQFDLYLRTHINQQLSIDELAAHMSVSRSTLYNRCKEETGMGPLERFTQMKMEAVKSMLLKGARLKEIASIMNYSSEFSLSRAFKKHTGESPREFRLSHSA